jgi:hypothetical protein
MTANPEGLKSTALCNRYSHCIWKSEAFFNAIAALMHMIGIEAHLDISRLCPIASNFLQEPFAQVFICERMNSYPHE